MTLLPEHDPLSPRAITPPGDQPAPSTGEEFPPLEGMIFCPFLTPADLDGSNWAQPEVTPAFPAAIPESPSPADDTDLKAAAPLSQDLGPAEIPPVETTELTRPAKDWPRPICLFPERIQEILTPLGRNAVKSSDPSLYGNLAGSAGAASDRSKPSRLSPEYFPEQPALTEDAELTGAGSAGQGLNSGRIQLGDPGNSTAAGRDESQLIHLSPEGRFSENPHEIPTLPETLTIVESPLAAFPDQTPHVPAEPAERLLFQTFYKAKVLPPPARNPHLGHLLVLAILAFLGLLGASLLTRSALHFHLFSVSTVKQAESDIYYTLGSMAALYLITFVASLLIFPLLWHKGLFAGLQWNVAAARRRVWLLMAAACACFALAIIDELLLPGPANAPIDKLFDTRAAAWLLFAFGVTVAPFFEEIFFRGFLLPALCTACDWLAEKASGNPAPPLGPNGHPQWSIPSMGFASILTSVPFALMHAEQTAHALGPFLLLVAVSLVLCWARLSTRSLAASVIVHASYNFLLFSLMLLFTGGFQHLDKM